MSTSLLEIRGKHCRIWMQERPHYCDRGNWLAHLEVDSGLTAHLALYIDAADGWPRYYFDLERAKLEILAWLRKRDEWITDTFEEQSI